MSLVHHGSTNVAETSLTIDGTRLVVDSGLANEARYDPKRRIQVLHLVRICRSSADQRKVSESYHSRGRHLIQLPSRLADMAS